VDAGAVPGKDGVAARLVGIERLGIRLGQGVLVTLERGSCVHRTANTPGRRCATMMDGKYLTQDLPLGPITIEIRRFVWALHE
jgi:hypothetical protein